MHVKRALATTVAGGALLLGLGVVPAAAGEYDVTVLGRKVQSFSSTKARWVGSAQGEYVSAFSAKGEQDALRARAAVQETSGVRRAVIYDVTLQRQLDGRWQTVTPPRTKDVTSTQTSAQRAYAVAYTAPYRHCALDSDFTRRYRVVSRHAVRRNDGVMTNPRTAYSAVFLGPKLQDDSECPPGFLTVVASSDDLTQPWYVGDPPRTLHMFMSWNGITEADEAENVDARVLFSEGITVTDEPDGWIWDETTPHPNDWVYNEDPDTWSYDQVVEGDWELVASEAGPQVIDATLTTTTPNVAPADRSGLPWDIEVLEPFTE